MDLTKELGVKGFCFRGYDDNRVVADKVKACGLDRIDLSGCQVQFKTAAEHEPAILAFQEADIKIVGIGAVLLSGDASDEMYFKFCQQAGCRTISFNVAPAVFSSAVAQAEKWAEEYDMKLAIHNHGGKHWLGNSEMLQHVLEQHGPRVGLCIDTAWCIQAGEDPLRWLELFAGRVHAVHFKDFRFNPNGQYHDVIVGEGGLDLTAFVRGLAGIGFDGPAVIEYEGDVDNPVPALASCVERVLSAVEASRGVS